MVHTLLTVVSTGLGGMMGETEEEPTTDPSKVAPGGWDGADASSISKINRK